MVERIVSIDPCGDGQNVYSWGEEVVRCRDCSHASHGLMGERKAMFCSRLCVDEQTDDLFWETETDGFCAWGERRDAR